MALFGNNCQEFLSYLLDIRAALSSGRLLVAWMEPGRCPLIHQLLDFAKLVSGSLGRLMPGGIRGIRQLQRYIRLGYIKATQPVEKSVG